MIIQINTDNNISGKENTVTYFTQLVKDSLDRYSEHLSRIEIHLSDENGNKNSKDDKHCVLEVRIEGKQPIAVTSNANTIEGALNTAIEKVSTLLNTTIGQMKNHR
ncbi:MAG: HPF/RaiA family ribosome-associated protein [Bacteroidia bacterium]